MDIEQDLEAERRDALLRHITNVQKSCFLLGERLIKSGEDKIGHDLMANGLIHDNSKWHGIEWLYLHSDLFGGEHNEHLSLAIRQHVTTNPHHPEYWDSEPHKNDGIHQMPRIYSAEMIADWHARATEFGTDLRSWIIDKATKKFNMTVQSPTYKDIKGLVSMLLDPAFSKVKKATNGKA